MKTKVRRVAGIIMLIAAAVLLIFAYLIYLQYKHGIEAYEQLEDEVVLDDDFTLDWDKLMAENPDIVGWIRMDPEISYPIVQGEDNSYYLHRGFDREYNINGCIFMHAECSPDWSDKNTIVYGHNMNNGSMFGMNKKYMDKEYAEEHPEFRIYVPGGYYTYRIFDTMTVSDASRPYTYGIKSDDEFEEYLKDMESLASYTLPVPVTKEDQIVTLSTCTNHGRDRFLIQGVLASFTDDDGNETSAEEMHAEKKAKQEAIEAERKRIEEERAKEAAEAEKKEQEDLKEDKGESEESTEE